MASTLVITDGWLSMTFTEKIGLCLLNVDAERRKRLMQQMEAIFLDPLEAFFKADFPQIKVIEARSKKENGS